jgi:hypothetical protein
MEPSMNLFHTGDISLFVGDSLQEPSELQFLNKLCSDLMEMGEGGMIKII